MWKITEETHVGECIMPKNCEFFLDPIDTIKHYKRCPLNKNNSSIFGYGLATVWCYLKNQKELIGAHDSLIDAQAQSAICDDDKFFSFLDKPVGIVTLNSILEPKRRKRRQQEEELSRQLIKRGLEMDWDGPPTDIKGRPAYTRLMNLVPCQCDGVQCFFCEYGHTHGIDHMKKGQKRKTQTSRLTATEGHTSGRKEISRYTSYCRVCYSKARNKFPEKTNNQLRRYCNNTRLGCPGCNNGNGLFVCKDCWENSA